MKLIIIYGLIIILNLNIHIIWNNNIYLHKSYVKLFPNSVAFSNKELLMLSNEIIFSEILYTKSF
jgi:hypothetical protein